MPDNINLKIPDKTIDKAYDDLLHPVASETGKLLGRVTRALNAAFAPLDQWILQREMNVAQTKKTLEDKLAYADPEKIVTPEPYVAVPALQYISYSISNKELYDLYANLLSKAMYADTKEKVHPSFVEIIKQLSPADALVLKEFTKSKEPIAAARMSIILRTKGLQLVGQPKQVRYSLELVSDIQIDTLSEEQIQVSVDNLKRLGLITLSDFSLSENNKYAFVKNTSLYSRFQQEFERLNQIENTAERISIDQKILSLTSIGELFCNICILGFE